MKISNQTYDTIKLIALLIAPTCVLITSVANAIGYDASVIVAILAAVDVFIGSVVKILSDNYHEGGDAE